MLTIHDHRRDQAGLTYVYPVVSRRAGGVSIGINLNPNNACNWACSYCQVEGLVRGGPPPIDLALLGRELTRLLSDVLQGEFMVREVPEPFRVLKDVAFSGNGEPTSAAEFESAVGLVLEVLEGFGLSGKLPLRLITNGSLMHRASVQRGIARLGVVGGEVWFKVDRVTPEGMLAVNGVPLDRDSLSRRLDRCTDLVTTWVQTCWFATSGESPSAPEVQAYIDFLTPFAGRLAGIHLYGIARPSMQPGGERLTPLSAAEMEHFAAELQKATGLTVRLAP